MFCACSENRPHHFSSTVVLRTYVYSYVRTYIFYVRTYILWATAGTTGKTVVNLRSRNTKQTQMMRVTQQQQHSTAEAVKLQQ